MASSNGDYTTLYSKELFQIILTNFALNGIMICVERIECLEKVIMIYTQIESKAKKILAFQQGVNAHTVQNGITERFGIIFI